MSSRRKQSKPKAFGMSDDEVEVTAANGQASLISDKPETSDQTTTSCSISQGQENITIRSEETTSNNYSEVGIKVNGKETPIDEIANANERKRKRDEEETDVDQTFDEVSTNTNKIKSSHFETDNVILLCYNNYNIKNRSIQKKKNKSGCQRVVNFCRNLRNQFIE